MKTMSKKIASIVLALCLCFSLVGTALAATSSDADSFSITVTGAAEGETYNAYKIFDVTYDIEDTDSEYAYSYTIDYSNAWFEMVQNGYTVGEEPDVETVESPFTLTQVGDSSTYVVTVKDGEEYDDDYIISFFTNYGVPAGADAAATAVGVDTGDVDENGDPIITATLDVTESGAGYYYVTTSLGSLVIIDTTNPDPEINEKNGIPTISKWVYNDNDEDWEHDDDSNNQGKIYFELEVDHITGAVNLVIHDSMMHEFTEEDWETFTLDYIAIIDGENIIELTEDDYTIVLTGAVGNSCTKPDCEINDEEYAGCTFEIDFTGYDFSGFSDDAYIEVIYDAILDTEGDDYGDYDVDEIDNWAMVTFGATSGSVVVEAETYSFGFEVFKYTGDLNSAIWQSTTANEGNPDATDTYYLRYTAEDGTYYYAIGTGSGTSTDDPFVVTSWTTDRSADGVIYAEVAANAGTTYYFTGNIASVHCFFEFTGETAEIDEYITLVEDDTHKVLEGVQFELRDENGNAAYFEYEKDLDTYLFLGWNASDVPEGVDATQTLTTGEDGFINIEGLDQGTYYLYETKALDGYNPLTGAITVTITATYDDETGALVSHYVTYSYNGEDGDGIVNVENNTGTELPSTGGIGTTIFYIIGGILVVGAVVVLVTRRRMTRSEG